MIDGKEDGNLSDAINIYQFNASAQNNLWGIFIAAAVATSGFVLTNSSPAVQSARIAMTVGYLAFAIGHAYLLYRSRCIFIAAEELLRETDSAFLGKLINTITDAKSTWYLPLIPHVVIDIAVIVVIWSNFVPCAS